MTLPYDIEHIGVVAPDDGALDACQQVVAAFCELLDAGDAEGAFRLHLEDLEFFPPMSDAALPRSAAQQGAVRILTSYPGRRTVHLVSNFIGRRINEVTVRAQYVITVYELTQRVGDHTVERAEPTLFALAHEHADFAQDALGRWRYQRQRMIPIAPLSPFTETESA